MFIISLSLYIILCTNVLGCGIPYEYPKAIDIKEAIIRDRNITDKYLLFLLETEKLYCPLRPYCDELRRDIDCSQYGYLNCCNTNDINDDHRNGLMPLEVNIVNAIAQCEVGSEIDIGNKTCVRPQVLAFNGETVFTTKSYYMINKCSNDYGNTEVLTKCEISDPLLLEPFDESAFVPVSLSNTSKTFKNIYCAMCNNVEESLLVQWPGFLECSEGIPFVTAPSSFRALYNNLKNAECNIIFRDPVNMAESCNWGYFTTCNQTGKWATYNEWIYKACTAYTSLYMGKYRNVFCFICNNDIEQPKMGCTDSDLLPPTGGFAIGPFTALLNFRSKAPLDKVNKECSENHVFIQEQCLEIVCPSYYYYDTETKTCRAVLNEMSNQHYSAYYKTMVSDNQFECNHTSCYSTVGNEILEAIYKYLKTQFSGLYLSCSSYPSSVFVKTNKETNSTLFVFEISFLRGLLHDQENVLDILTFPFDVSLTLTHNIPLTITLLSHVEFESLHDLTPLSLSPPNFDNFGNFGNIDNSLMCYYDFQLVEVVEKFYCPRLNLDQINASVVSNGLEIVVKDIKIRLDLNRVKRSGKHFLVCVDDFNTAMNISQNDSQVHSTSEKETATTVEQYLSLSCSILSITCLLLTLVVYGMMKELRTIPGWNTIMLSAHLMIAHALYLFGINANSSAIICAIVGGATHYFWLSSIMWMSICAIHMFRALYFMRTANHNFSKWSVFFYFSFALTVTVICMSINLVYTRFTRSTERNNFGYGGETCYISEPLMILITFTCPLGVVVLSNSIMFILVICKIEALPNVASSNTTHRHTFSIYFKLTSIIGLTWILGFVYQWTNINVISYIFIVLNASQGLYIFVCFGCSRRVRERFNLISKDSKRVTMTTMITAKQSHEQKLKHSFGKGNDQTRNWTLLQ